MPATTFAITEDAMTIPGFREDTTFSLSDLDGIIAENPDLRAAMTALLIRQATANAILSVVMTAEEFVTEFPELRAMGTQVDYFAVSSLEAGTHSVITDNVLTVEKHAGIGFGPDKIHVVTHRDHARMEFHPDRQLLVVVR
jgi:hypothetical protein